MKISIVSVFPQLYEPFLSTSLVHRAQENGHVSITTSSFFSYVVPKERIDSPTFGHGAGMLLKPEVVQKAIEDKEQKHGKAYRIFFSPHGKILTQQGLQRIVGKAQEKGHLMLIAGRYEGMDARIEDYYADEIVSIGNFVLMGGDLPAMVFLEGALRLLPGVVGKQESVEHESFSGPFVDYPEYTAPVSWQGHEVPAVVRSGDHEQLRKWRQEKAVERTVKNHFDWLRSYALTAEQKGLVCKVVPNHYVALMHCDVCIGPEKLEGTTSVTSMDIHDIARSCKTYGIKEFFIVTPLLDQKRIVQTLLDFWHTGVGIDYNPHRHQAVKQVSIRDSFDEVMEHIEKIEGKKPLVVATSARVVGHSGYINFCQQAKVWQQERPVLLIFGTGRGLTQKLIDRCDFLLVPLDGLTEFNHLSVRSATAIVLDRWLGLDIKHL